MAYEDEHFIDTGRMVWNYSLFSGNDVKAFAAGNMVDGYEKFGSRGMKLMGQEGYYFAVWAPHAESVSVVGDFNGWKPGLHNLFPRLDHSGIWEGFIPRLTAGLLYKYHITAPGGWSADKADPFARHCQLRPETASVLWNSHYQWQDSDWMHKRPHHNSLNAPWAVYELHLGSWMRPDRNDEHSFHSYRHVAELLIPYLLKMGFTHVEFMPLMEFPFDGSWGYQGTGYFAPTSRFGSPEDLMFLVDALHRNGIGVIFDWVPSHFPGDPHGLYMFDGAHTYEYADMRKGFHPDWNSYIFNYARGEVVSFLLSSAHYWMDLFHADGLRVDAVNSMIRLDFSRKEGEWEPNEQGGNENLDAIRFLKKLNTSVYKMFKGIQTIAEEASDWPGISKPVRQGGFGFGMKWMMGWMHDSFRYFRQPPSQRANDQDSFSFSMMYFYDEKFMLPLSHDEVVHGKSPMLYKMPGNEKEKFANLRLLYAYLYTHPGAKMLFMGNEFAQTSEWNYSSELDWHLLQYPVHSGMQQCVSELNHIYRNEPALHELQFERKGFEWVDLGHRQECVMSYMRLGKKKDDRLVIILNTSANHYEGWHVRIKSRKQWREIFNSNRTEYGGTGEWLNPVVHQVNERKDKMKPGVIISIPPLSAVILKSNDH